MQKSHPERGNILFIILIAIALIGMLTAAILNSGGTESANIDSETLTIRASEVQRYSSELERAVNYVLQNGFSESDIRFAHTNAPSAYGDLSGDADKTDQVFHRSGGGANYRTPSSDISSASQWEFYGTTHLPSVGSSRAEHIAVLPNVTQQFCDKINTLNSQASTPTDTGTCLWSDTTNRFNDSVQFLSSPNTVDETTFDQDTNTSAARTALQGCVTCSTGSTLHFYHVILAR